MIFVRSQWKVHNYTCGFAVMASASSANVVRLPKVNNEIRLRAKIITFHVERLMVG